MKASIFAYNGIFLLGAVHRAMCATDSTTLEDQISGEEPLTIAALSSVSTVAAEFEVKNMDASFDDPGGQAPSAATPGIHDQALHSSDDYTLPEVTIHFTSVMVKCNDQELHRLCSKPPFNIRCADGCDSNTICAIIVDHPHVLCESECTCIAGDKVTIPTFNEFADLE